MEFLFRLDNSQECSQIKAQIKTQISSHENLQLKNQSNRGRLLLLLVLSLAFCGCGVKKTYRNSGSDESASRTTDRTAATCNHFSSTTVKLGGKMSTYTSVNGSPSDDYVRIRLTNIDGIFDTDAKYKIRLFKLKGTTSNEIIQDTEPLDFRVEIPFSTASGGQVVSGYMQYINITDVDRIKTANALQTTKAQDFFQKIDLVAINVDLTWDLLRVVLYKDTTETEWEPLGWAEGLIPAFVANPNEYALDHPNTLNVLHPLWDERTQANMDFATTARSWCF